MAIAYDAVSNFGDDTGTLTSKSGNHICTGSNRILFVGVRDGSNSVTGVTYNSVAMTFIDVAAIASGGGLFLYYLKNPASGTNSITVTRTGTGTILWVNGVSYTGALQTGVMDASGKDTANAATSISKTITTVADNCWWVAVGGSHNNNLTAGSGMSLRTGGSYGVSIGDGNSAKTPAGNVTANFNAGSSNLGIVMASFAPSIDVNGNILFF